MSAIRRAQQQHTDGSNGRWSRSRTVIGRGVLVAALSLAGIFVLGTPAASAATNLTVSTTADIGATAGSCGNSNTTPPSPLSLREATCIANNVGGAVNINIPAGTYNLANGEIQPGIAAGSNISLIGSGAGSTIINAGGNSRVIDLDKNLTGGVSTTISGLTITGGADSTFGGAGIIGGSGSSASADVLTMDNVIVTGNQANGADMTVAGKSGGGVQFTGGELDITNSTFSNNTSGSSPGSAIAYSSTGQAPAPSESLNITGSTFSGNATINTHGDTNTANGGALALSGPGVSAVYQVLDSKFINNTSTSSAGSGPAYGGAIWEQSGYLTVGGSTFTGNSATDSGNTASGGAVEVESAGTATLYYSRFVGNIAQDGSAIHSSGLNVDPAHNWFGCNAGPGGAGCDTVSGTGSVNPRLLLTATASPATLTGPNATSTLSASFGTDSSGGGVPGLHVFDSLPATFSDPPGDATVTSSAGSHTAGFGIGSGHADIDYHSGTVIGPDPVNVTFDNQTVTVTPTINQAPAITSANTAHFNVGQAGSFTLTTTGYPNPAITRSGTLPSGLSFTDNGDGTATLSGTPTGGGGTFPLTITANNGVAPNATQTLTLTVGQPPAFTSGSTATFRVGNPGSFTVTTSGIPTVSAITESGTLPPNMGFTDNGDGTATISGSPNGPGNTYPVTLTATNGVAPNATQNLTIQVNQSPAIQGNPSDQTVQPGTSVSFTAAASGVPTPTVQWQRSTDGGGSFTNIVGATSTTYTFTAASGDNGNQYQAVFSNVGGSTNTSAATLNVGTAPVFTSADNTSFVVGQAGSFPISTNGVPSATLSRTGAQFPAWLTLTDNGDGTGTLTGTPPAGAAGQYQFTLKAANGFSPSASQIFTLFVDDSPVITSANHATVTTGQAGSFAVTTTAGFPTTTAITKTGSLPSGVTFTDNGDGTATLAGTPTAGTGGTYSITITATASGGSAAPASQPFTLTVNEPPVITSADHATFSVGSAGSFTVSTAAGTPSSATITKTGTLPSGVTFTDNGDGTATIAGTPAFGTGGVYTLTITASNGVAPDATQSFTMTVNQPPVITSANHVTFTVGAAAGFTVTTAPGQPTATTITETGTLPPGVSFTDNGDGTATIGGTPTAGGTFSLTVKASNGVAPDASQTFTITVNQPPVITSTDHATFSVGSAGSFTVTTVAGTPSSSTITETGALPSGVTFTDNGDGTATLAGTPAAGQGGSYPITITASNGVLPNATQSFTLTVLEPTQITSADHATFGLGTVGSFTVTTAGGFPAPAVLSRSGSLPAGVSFTDNGDGTATLAGTPTEGGSYPITITANNGVAPNATQSFTLTVNAPPTITSADHVTFAVGTAGSFTVTSAPGTPSATTLTESGALPNGLSFTDNGDGTATLAGTPTAGQGGSYPLTITASNGVLPNSVQSFTLTVTQLPAITSANSASFPVAASGSFTVTTTPGFPPATTLTETGALPSGVTFTDNGDGTAALAGTPQPGTAGTYPLTITATNSAGHVDQAFTLTVGKVAQTITVTSQPVAPVVVGGSYTPTATSDSALPVSFSIDASTTNGACTLGAGVVHFEHAGNCVLDADQSGDGVYAAAAQVQQPITVGTVATSVAIALTPATSVYGQSVTATATVSAGEASPAGTVQFTVDGNDLGNPVTVVGDQAPSPALVDANGGALEPGAHPIGAQFTPTDTVTYASSSNTTSDQVSQGQTMTTVAVHAHTITADVAAKSPAGGTPTGTVTFNVAGTSVGTAQLVDGTATLSHTVPVGKTQSVGAAYGGSTDFAASSDSTSRHDPRITATVSSYSGRTHFRWYRSAVHIRFHCTTNGAALAHPCPAAVTLTRNKAGQAVSRTITATDGGMATVSVTGISIDRVAPTVAVKGIHNGAVYASKAPAAHCVAHDGLSGVFTCKITRHSSGGVTTYRAVATDRAGNRKSISGHYRTNPITMQGAALKNGAYQVHIGRTYTLVVVASKARPVYYDAATYPKKPIRRDHAFHAGGHQRWVLGVTMTRSLRSHRYWNLGVKIGHTMHKVEIHIV